MKQESMLLYKLARVACRQMFRQVENHNNALRGKRTEQT